MSVLTSRSAIAEVQPGCEPLALEGTGDRAHLGVVLTHGFTGNPRATRPMAEVLNGAGFTVNAIRLPGHGTSVRDLATTRYDDWRGALDQALLDMESKVDHIVLVGHSMGGTLSVDVASSGNDRIVGCVAINPQILTPRQVVAKLAPVLQYVLPFVPRDLAGLPTDDIARPDVSEQAYSKVSARAAQSLINNLPRIRAQLLDLTMPLLVVSSPEDHTVPAENSDALVELVGSGQVTRLITDRSYHVPQLDWDRAKVEEGVLGFVEGIHGGMAA